MSPTELESALRRGWQLEEKFKQICDQQGQALDRVLEYAQTVSIDELTYLLEKMPPGFHRSEIRYLLRSKAGNAALATLKQLSKND